MRAFLEAAHDNSLMRMGELWGSPRGPAIRSMDRSQMEQRLTVMRIYLAYEQYDFVTDQRGSALHDTPSRRTLRVRLTRNGCAPVVPISVVRYGRGWLVSDVDLQAAGNPAVHCAPPGSPSR